MKDIIQDNGVRDRLLIAGINELHSRGINDFSLRRVASAAQVSCAAPYRHFSGKDEFICEIIKYIESRFDLFAKEINTAYADTPNILVTELAAAYVRFWFGNPNFRSVLLNFSDSASVFALPKPGSSLACATEKYCEKNNIAHLKEQKLYSLMSLVFGTVMLMGIYENRDELISMLRDKLAEEFK